MVNGIQSSNNAMLAFFSGLSGANHSKATGKGGGSTAAVERQIAGREADKTNTTSAKEQADAQEIDHNQKANEALQTAIAAQEKITAAQADVGAAQGKIDAGYKDLAAAKAMPDTIPDGVDAKGNPKTKPNPEKPKAIKAALDKIAEGEKEKAEATERLNAAKTELADKLKEAQAELDKAKEAGDKSKEQEEKIKQLEKDIEDLKKQLEELQKAQEGGGAGGAQGAGDNKQDEGKIVEQAKMLLGVIEDAINGGLGSADDFLGPVVEDGLLPKSDVDKIRKTSIENAKLAYQQLMRLPPVGEVPTIQQQATALIMGAVGEGKLPPDFLGPQVGGKRGRNPGIFGDGHTDHTHGFTGFGGGELSRGVASNIDNWKRETAGVV